MSSLVQPHGGTLIDRLVPPTEADAFRDAARGLPSLVLDARELADLELIGTGAASPLTGFLGSVDYESVLARMRLADGTVWPLPLTLAVADQDAAGLERGAPVALRDAAGRLAGILSVREVHRRDPLAEARSVYRRIPAWHTSCPAR
jgi:sulfate adenylyltransferase